MENGSKRVGLKLAILVMSAAGAAHAGVIAWGPAGTRIWAPGGGGTPSGTADASPTNGGSGLKLSGGAQMTFDAADPSFVAGQLSGPVIVWWNATDSGPQGTFDSATLPVTYDFTALFSPAAGGQDQAVSWTLDLIMSSLLNSHYYSAETIFTGTTAVGGGTVIGSGMMNVPLIGSFLGWQFTLEAEVASADGATISLSVPSHSIDLNHTASAAPEPGSIGLILAGSLWMWTRRGGRRR